MAARSHTVTSGSAEPPGGNLAVVWGPCPGGVEIRELGSGSRVASLSVTTPVPGRSATSVPVTVWDPPAWLGSLEPGEAVVVVGVVRRRFYRSGAGTRGSRCEVEALRVARATPAQLERSRARAVAGLDALATP